MARVDRGLLLTEIAAEARSSTSSVKTWLARHGIHRTPRTPNPLLADRDWLIDQIDQGHSVNDIAKSADVSPSTVSAWVRRHGFTDRTNIDRHEVLGDRQWVVERLANGESRSSIARGLGCSTERVSAAIRHFGLRSTAEATIEERSGPAASRRRDGDVGCAFDQP